MSTIKRVASFVALLALLAGGPASCVTQPAVRAIASSDVAVDAAALERHVRKLSSALHTAFLRTPNYHGAGDVADTLDYVRMAKVIRSVHAVAMEF